MRRALVVGLDDYPFSQLSGCVADANRIADILSNDYDGSPNFSCQRILSPPTTVTRAMMREGTERLFRDDPEVALFYFSGHGTVNNLGGYLVTPDAEAYDQGVAMQDILIFANNSAAREVIIILDCCHSGALGQIPVIDNKLVVIREGVSILTASRDSQAAVEIGGEGLFTSLVCDALEGGAADLVGDVTIASIYTYADQALGPWDQRPLYKSHVSKLIKIRRSEPAIEPNILRLLPSIFKSPDEEITLDPSYEPKVDPHHPQHEETFGYLQQYRNAGLLNTIGADSLYEAAINSKTCILTPKGQFYWRVASSNQI
ncbi:MAG: caspase family protein [Planctomycetes bacterium]|nr:caspase family protein [Planctomycetota bacterium]